MAGAAVRVVRKQWLLGNRFGVASGGIHAVVVVAFRGLAQNGVVRACRGRVLSPSGLEWHQQTKDQQPAKAHGGSLVAGPLHKAITAHRP